MGVKGLWDLLDRVGRPVSLDSMEDKILAVDTSIWIHQAISGFRDKSGNPVANAHLLSLFNRVCKLLMYKIKPVFVFDGSVPELKKRTMKLRREMRNNAKDDAKKIREKILLNLVQSCAIKSKLNGANNSEELAIASSSASSSQKQSDMFELPPLPKDEEEKDGYDESSSSDSDNMSVLDRHQYLNSLDVEGDDFKALPLEMQHELLSEMKESRKRHSWNKIDQLPSNLNDFSSFQMQTLLKKRDLQRKIENTQKAMEIHQTSLITGETFENQFAESRRIVSEDCAHYLLVKGRRNVAASTSTTRNQLFEKTVVDDSAKKTETGFHEVKNTNSIEAPDKVEPVKEVKSDCSSIKVWAEDFPDVFAVDVSESSSDDSVENVLVGKSTTPIDAEIDKTVPEVAELDSQNQGETAKLNEESLAIILPVDHNLEKANVQNPTTLKDVKMDKMVMQIQVDEKKVEENVNDVEKGLTVVLPVEDKKLDEYNMKSTEESSAVMFTSDDRKTKDDTEVVNLMSSDSEEDDFMEIVIDPTKAVEDELFPAEIFATSESSQPEPLPDNNEITSEVASIIQEPGPEPIEELNVEQLEALHTQLHNETENLMVESGKLERMAQTLTGQMCFESQELLRLFGVPYVVSPTEAEAQCATLDRLDLTDGTITDDSDIWLFGGRKVYKNFYNQNKDIMYVNDTDVAQRLALNRSKMIALSLLTGCDYTVGIRGVGIVCAMEILAEFPNDDGVESLRMFRKWWDKRQKQKKAPSAETKVKQKLARLSLSEGFPSCAVVEAFLSPTVDESKQRFSWAIPDLDSLRQFASSKFGWTLTKIDAMLEPVIKRMNDKQIQPNLHRYFAVTSKVSGLNRSPSKRLGRAITRVASAGTKAKGGKGNAMSKLKRTAAKTLRGKGKTNAKRTRVIAKDVNLSETDSSADSN